MATLNPYLPDAERLIGLGAAVCEVAHLKPDATCSCRLGDQCPSAGKHPVGRDWMKVATARRSKPTYRIPSRVSLAPAMSYGLIPTPGSRLIVIDRDDPTVLLPMRTTLEVHRSSADPRRGHYWFRLTDCIDESDVPRAFAGGEVRVAASGHVVGPGCRHTSGDLYVSNGAAVGTAGRDLIDALSALRPVRRGATGEVEAVAGSRHAWLVNQARKYRGWGRDEEWIVDRLRQDNDEYCDPPLSDRAGEFERMARWAVESIVPDLAITVGRRSPSKRQLRAMRGWPT